MEMADKKDLERIKYNENELLNHGEILRDENGDIRKCESNYANLSIFQIAYNLEWYPTMWKRYKEYFPSLDFLYKVPSLITFIILFPISPFIIAQLRKKSAKRTIRLRAEIRS